MSRTLATTSSRMLLRTALVICVLWAVQEILRGSGFWAFRRRRHSIKSPCDSLGGLDDLMLVIKTGANEATEKLPVHFNTTLRCVPHYALFSDLEEEIEGEHIYDALDEVDPEIRATHPEFEYYRRVQEQGRDAYTAADEDRWRNMQNSNIGRNSPGWKLDKWKFLPLAERALRLRPDAKWYLFLEADTYVLWEPMQQWLSHFRPSQALYIGHEMSINSVIFAYGGAGFVLSQPALEAVVEHRRSHLNEYDGVTAKEWAGDCVLGKAMANVGVQLTWAWPTLLGDGPIDMDFNNDIAGGSKRLWCHYVVTYHHLSPNEVTEFHEFESKWRQENGTFLRHGDVFKHFVYPELSSRRVDWDNLSGDFQSSDCSFEECEELCLLQAGCMQFSVVGKTCRTSNVIKRGRFVTTTPAQQVVSGWMMDRVDAFIKAKDAACGQGQWVLP